MHIQSKFIHGGIILFGKTRFTQVSTAKNTIQQQIFSVPQVQIYLASSTNISLSESAHSYTKSC